MSELTATYQDDLNTTLMIKYLTVINRRNRVYLERGLRGLASFKNKRKATKEFMIDKVRQLKACYFKEWRNGFFSSLMVNRFLRQKKLKMVRNMWAAWRKKALLAYKSKTLCNDRESKLIWRYFESFRFAHMHYKTLVAKFQWKLQDSMLKRYFVGLRKYSQKSKRLDLKLRMYKLKADAKSLSLVFTAIKELAHQSTRSRDELEARIKMRKLRGIMKHWSGLSSTRTLLTKLLKIALAGRKRKIFKAFSEQIRKDLISKLKRTINEQAGNSNDSNDHQHSNSRTISIKPKDEEIGNEHNFEHAYGSTIKPDKCQSYSGCQTDMDYRKMNSFDSYKQHVLKNIMDFRNQASDIKFSFNNLHKTNSDYQDVFHRQTPENQLPTQSYLHPNTTGLSRISHSPKIAEKAQTHKTNPQPSIPPLTKANDLSHSSLEQIIQTNMALLESKVAFLKLHKQSMTPEESERAKSEIKSQITKIKLYQQALLGDNKLGGTFN